MQEPLAGAIQSDQLITLTMGQLQGLISRAVQEAIDPIEARIQALAQEVRERGAGGGEEAIQDLKDRMEALEDATAKERAFDRQRIARLERVDPQPLQKDRGDILRALIAANGGKMLAKDARKKMRLDEATFSRLLEAAEKFIEKKPYHLDKRQSVLIIK